MTRVKICLGVRTFNNKSSVKPTIRNNYKSIIIGNKHKKHIEIVYYKKKRNILSIVYNNDYRTLKRLYDRKSK